MEELLTNSPYASERRKARQMAAKCRLALTRTAVALTALLVLISGFGCADWDTSSLGEAPPLPAQTSQIYGSDGSVIASLHAVENRELVAITEMATAVKLSVVAVEDPSFFDHEGVDYRAIGRAVVRNVESGEPAEGGSTITQQYIKNTFVGNERTIERKMREATLAMQIEKTLPKEKILELYLNTVYFGRGAYGIEAASRLYFQKHAVDLKLAEAALLAGMIQSPGKWDPYSDLQAALKRRDRVFDQLVKTERLTRSEVDSARSEPVDLAPFQELDRFTAPYFVDWIRQWILADPGFGETPSQRADLLYKGGLKIETTLLPSIQSAAETAVKGVLFKKDDPYASLVAIDPRTGAVRAMVGGRDYFSADDPKAKFNMSTQAKRQPGSAFKAFVLATALSNGIDEKKVYRGGGQISIPIGGGEVWDVKNFDGHSYGAMTVRQATTFSVNVVYAQMMKDLGPTRVVSTAHKMGITSDLKAVYAVGLGSEEVTPLEMAGAYQTLANNGEHITPYGVSKITNGNGDIIYQAEPKTTKALDSAVAAKTNDILQDVMKQGTGVDARFGRPAAGKTGTSENNADAWFVGYTPDLVASVWVGFPTGQVPMVPPTTRETVLGGTWPAQIWQQFMSSALEETPATPFPPPDGGPLPLSGIEPLPDFKGWSLAEAEGYLTGLGYKVSKRFEYNTDFPPDRIMRQEPPAGTQVSLGGTVSIVVTSLEGRPLPVPRLLGLSRGDADSALELAGFKGKVRVQAESKASDAKANGGRVWKQQPAPDSLTAPGSTIEYWVNPEVPASTDSGGTNSGGSTKN